MKRWVIKPQTFGLEGLIQENVPTPEPGFGEIRIRVRAVSFNRRDLMALERQRQKPEGRELVPLCDGAGEIDGIGPGVSQWINGDRVTSVFFRNWVYGPPHSHIGRGLGSGDEDGMLAEQVVLSADRVVRMPTTLDFIEAATLPCAGLTAWNALFGAAPVGPGSKVLILGSGGVSLYALLFARATGVAVIATTGNASKADQLRAMGVAEVLNYKDNLDWGEAVFKMTGGVDKVIEVGGIGSLHQSLAALGTGGEIAMIGTLEAGSDLPDLSQLRSKAANIRGISVGNIEMFVAMARAIDGLGLKPTIAKCFDFDEVHEAYRAQQSSAMFGKIVVRL